MVNKRRTNRKRNPSKKKVVKTALKRSFNNKIARIASSVIMRKAETKTFTHGWTDNHSTLQNGSGLAGEYRVLSPINSGSIYGWTLPVGDTDGARDGPTLQPVNLQFQYVTHALPYNATTNPVPKPYIVRMYFFHCKKYPSQELIGGDLINLATADFFEVGTQDAGFAGNVIDMCQKLNKKGYTYLTQRTLKIGFSAYDGLGGTAGAQYYQNNDFKQCVYGSVNLSKYLPSKITWGDNDGVPRYKWIHMVTQVVPADGTTPSTTIVPVSTTAKLIFTYKDF